MPKFLFYIMVLNGHFIKGFSPASPYPYIYLLIGDWTIIGGFWFIAIAVFFYYSDNNPSSEWDIKYYFRGVISSFIHSLSRIKGISIDVCQFGIRSNKMLVISCLYDVVLRCCIIVDQISELILLYLLNITEKVLLIGFYSFCSTFNNNDHFFEIFSLFLKHSLLN